MVQVKLILLWPWQVMGKVPTISINKTDGCHVYLSKSSLDCEIVSAKSSEMNVLIPAEGGDFVSAALESSCLGLGHAGAVFGALQGVLVTVGGQFGGCEW